MIQIYHNPRCGKSREGLEIIESSGKDFEVIKYLTDIPSKQDLLTVIKKLGIAPVELVRKNEQIWKEKFHDLQLTEDEVVNAMIAFPILIERPIVINGNKAVIGRPPEKIKDII